MHELLLFASVPAKQHDDLRQQLAGLTVMQPNHVLERHVLFKAYKKPDAMKSRPGGSQDVQPGELQKLNKMLGGVMYYLQAIGAVRPEDFGSKPASGTDATGAIDNAGNPTPAAHDGYSTAKQSWRLDFKDIPEAGARSAVTSRVVGSVEVPYGDIVATMDGWGFHYVSEYVVEGDMLVLDDTVLFLHRVLNFPPGQQGVGRPAESLPPLDQMVPLDSSGAYVLQSCITVGESGNPDLLKAASQRLLGLREHLRSVVKLEPADRLALDTRANLRFSQTFLRQVRIRMVNSRGTKRRGTEDDISPPPLKRKAEPTATSKAAVANFFTPASQKKPEQTTWRIIDNSCLIGKYTVDERKNAQDIRNGSKRRVVALDLDDTLIATKSGNKFARSPSDWKWWNGKVPDRLKELDAQGFLVVVISNQKMISLRKDQKGGRTESKSLSNFKQKVSAVMKALDIPLSVYAATESDKFRKPRTGMWMEILEDHDLDVEGALDLSGSVFVGDAAGRPNDHSCCDRDFATNIGIPFKTPEEFFFDQPPETIVRAFDPKTYIVTSSDEESQSPLTRLNDIELVIFCGSPSAGKSTFYWEYLQPMGYERVNQDILKTRQKCLKVAEEHLSAGKSVVVDNTNADTETRTHWILLAKSLDIPIRCVYFTTPPEVCKHNNVVRASNQVESLNPESRALLPGIAFGDFSRRFREPELSEGFRDITRVDFRFQGSDTAREAWGQYWI
ncbi:polynucleotide kinase 3'-phosphatase [Polytolypa hystricis UAMH7299]|uniref:Polynucleotide kinase 3'-phosphatase n=1 Tax=Polytolypa hystricis (strain UAMH7299) TaxID=1447883 RepID=A0A2B7Z2G0_POLH7|nr:polynucleotide kinase 3'-phosphatase [Polytolypa hystricis UAMH7299]